MILEIATDITTFTLLYNFTICNKVIHFQMRENLKIYRQKTPLEKGSLTAHLKCPMTRSALQWPEIYGDGLCRPMDKQEQLQITTTNHN